MHGIEWLGPIQTRRVLDERGIRHDPGHVGETMGAAPSPIEDLEAPRQPGTARRLFDVLRGKEAPPDVGAAFDSATLGPDDAPPIFPRNPVPPGGREPRFSRASTPTPRGRPAGADDLEGLFATGLVVLISFTLGAGMIPTEYEAAAISKPLANILARRIDLAARLGKDASDTIALAVALMAYGYRVAPIAAERVRSSLAAGKQRERIVEPTSRPANYAGADSVAPRQDNGAGTGRGAAPNPLDALAKARDVAAGVLARDLGPVPNGGNPLGAGGQPS
jgi:hypothetical protein